MPVYGMIIIFFSPTLFGYLPVAVKKLLLFVLLINNVFLPLSLLPYLKYRNHISSWSMDNRRERMLPLFFAAILYAATSYIIVRYPVPVFIKTFILGVFIVTLALTVINMWWKISIHATAAGAMVALVLVLSLKMDSLMLWPLLAVIISAGLVLSARLKLNAHTPPEVWWGFLSGLTVMGLLIWFF
jgi:hypothetical protein